MNEPVVNESAPIARDWPGYFIVVEGIDGTGKSTLVRGLAEALRARGREVVASFEPTNGPHGRRIRELAARGREGVTAEEEVALFIADRREHLEQLILPALRQGKVVILDRYFYSTMAYQGAAGLDPADIERRHKTFAPEPDMLVILDLPVDEALRRIIHKRGDTPDAFEGREYLEKVDAVFRQVRHPRLVRLDARQSPEELVARLMFALGDLSA